MLYEVEISMADNELEEWSSLASPLFKELIVKVCVDAPNMAIACAYAYINTVGAERIKSMQGMHGCPQHIIDGEGNIEIVYNRLEPSLDTGSEFEIKNPGTETFFFNVNNIDEIK